MRVYQQAAGNRRIAEVGSDVWVASLHPHRVYFASKTTSLHYMSIKFFLLIKLQDNNFPNFSIVLVTYVAS